MMGNILYLIVLIFMVLTAIHSAGGVKLVSGDQKIKIDNTLDERLKLLEDKVRYLTLISFSELLRYFH